MSKTPNYYIVEADALPEIFRKVVEARRMLDTGEAETVNQAVHSSRGSAAARFTNIGTRSGPSRICSMAGSLPFKS